MKKKTGQIMIRMFVVLADLAAAVCLALGLTACVQSGYDRAVWMDAAKGKDYLESELFQQQASESVYLVLQTMARSSRMEKDGGYDPDKIIRIRDYLESKTVYDMMPEAEKENGICYRLGDLYQWALKGETINQGILQETYRPLYYASIQEYANLCDEEYNVLTDQIIKAMDMLQRDMADYQEAKKSWSFEAVNVRYALRDLASGNICTNVAALQSRDIPQEEYDAYFKSFGSYYIFDSRSTSVAQENIGDYYAYNTHSFLTDQMAHLSGEYQVYVGIDTAFPVADEISVHAQEYEQAREMVSSWMVPMLASAAVLLLTAMYLLWKLAGLVRRFTAMVLSDSGTAFRLCVFFAAYELVQAVLRLALGDGAGTETVLLIYKLVVLALIVADGIQRQRLLTAVQAMADGEDDTRIAPEHLFFGNRQMAEAVNHLGEGLRTALQEQMKSERMKADLITNVSHDLKTPLTSIINYVDLMKREEPENPKVQEYLQVLDQKSQRLKQLTEDLVEASRASSGNVVLDIQRIDLKELLMQTSGEFEERFAARGLKLVADYPEHPLYVEADGRRLWRIIENLYRNVEKYAMPNTRVYLDVECDGQRAVMSMKNISEQPLNISAEELTERFIRGDESRSTEGSGLGLSIARDLTELQHGTFTVYLDGDLFKITVSFPWAAGAELTGGTE